MNLGTENRKKTITAAALGTVALICLGYLAYTIFGGGDGPTPPPSVVQVKPTAAVTTPAQGTASQGAGATGKALIMPTGNAAGVPATRLTTASASLDPSLDQVAMLRTESLVYSGAGRNIFSGTYTAPVVIPPPIAKARPTPPPQPPPVYIPPPPVTCPPTCPPINLKFFGTETHADGKRQAFLLQGDDVFLAAAGDIVARKYKIVTVNVNSIQVEDLANNNTQTLPLQSN